MSSKAGKRKRQNVKSQNVYDLMIPLAKASASIQIQNILQRLGNTGFTHAALTHTVYGIPRTNQDEAEQAIPENLWQTPGKKPHQVRVLRRLNAIIENLSDLSHYYNKQRHHSTAALSSSEVASTSDSAKILQGYDLVSVCPRNDAVFQSACTTANGADIIVLDYSLSKGKLPFNIRSKDVKAAVARNAVFEIPYSPAILNRSLRKGLIQTCRMLKQASLGCKPKIILGSGSRTVLEEEDDAGIMAFRSPSDLMNLMEVVMKLDRRSSYEAQHSACDFVLEQSHARRFGKHSITTTGMAVVEHGVEEDQTESEMPSTNKRKLDKSNGADKDSASDEDGAAGDVSPTKKRKVEKSEVSDASDEDGGGEDGFIAF